MGGKLDGAVVVVTGASSGIGRVTGLAFAERGARVVVAARRADALEELARECQTAGGQALAVPTNMTNEAAVTELARRAVERFGRMTRPSNGRLVADDDELDEHQSPDTDQQSPVWSGWAVLGEHP